MTTLTELTAGIAAFRVRPAIRQDLPRILELIVAHATYESVSVDTNGLARRLTDTMITPRNRATCFVAEKIGSPAVTAGYATCAAEFSTWIGNDYLHMDTLYVDENHRNNGIGALLIEAVVAHATALGVAEVQWQTPDWNYGAKRFYARIGARPSSKTRFKLPITTLPGERSNVELLDVFTNAWVEHNEDLLRSCLHHDVHYAPSVPMGGAPFVGIENVMNGIRAAWKYDTNASAEVGPSLISGPNITRTWSYTFADRPSQHGVDIFTFAHGLLVKKDAYRRGTSESG